MRRTLSHLPKHKRDELKLIVKEVRELARPEMIILFGSYARGNWVEGRHEQGRGRLTIDKKSDYDILVITKDKSKAGDANLWRKVNEKCLSGDLTTHARVIAHDIQHVNIQLAKGQYFFADIKKEGIVLYDSKKFKLARKRKLKPAEQKRIAQDHFDHWFGSAKGFYKYFEVALKNHDYKIAAFNLHQAAEHSYKAILLVFTDYSPDEHYLEMLGAGAAKHERALRYVFPKETEEQQELFLLLDYAYIGARYDPDYRITEEELKYLAGRVRELQGLTEKACKKKIRSFGA